MKHAIVMCNRIPGFVPRKQRIHALAMVLASSIALTLPAQADYEKGVQAWESGQYREALTEWMSAANADDGRAMLEIGRAYQQGLGVLQDYVEAYKWFNLAASRGVREALEERDALSAGMTEDERVEARALARQWRPDGGAETPSAPVADADTVQVVNPEPPPEAIREAQALLRALGYRPGPADGLWGQRTGAAYKSFLQEEGMPTSETLGMAALLAMRGIAKAQGIDETSLGAEVTPEALHQAAKAGDVTTLKAALDAGADVNRLDGKGWTALMHAVNKGNVLIVESLVEVGADVDVQAPDGATALFMAAVLGHPKIVELLMKANADISIQGPKGMTAVDAARLTLGEPAAVREQGMDSAVVGLVEGITWEELVWNETTRKFVDLLGRNPSAEAVDENGWTDLHWAAVLNLPKLAGWLLDAGTDAGPRLKGDSVLSVEFQVALRRVKDFNWSTWARNGETPLHMAGWFDAVEVAEVLIAHNADVHAKNNNGFTPLYYAAGGAVKAVEVLIAHGADVNAKNDNNFTPLHLASWQNAVEAAEILITHGADVHAKTNKGNTSLNIAKQEGHNEMMKLLQ